MCLLCLETLRFLFKESAAELLVNMLVGNIFFFIYRFVPNKLRKNSSQPDYLLFTRR